MKRIGVLDDVVFLKMTKCPHCGETSDNQWVYKITGTAVQSYCRICGRITNAKQLNESRWKQYVRERDMYTCQRCGKPLNGKAAHVHHKLPKWFMPKLALDPDNGIVLCNECHKQIHGYGGTINDIDKEAQNKANKKMGDRLEKALIEDWDTLQEE